MCLSAGDVSPLCDECFDKQEKEGEKAELCPACQELMTRYCWCCMKEYKTKEEAKIEEGVCATCRGE